MTDNINPNLKLTTVVFEPEVVVVTGSRNQTVSGKALVKNIGNETFVCQSVSKSCGCTTPSGINTGTIIEPGESKELDFTIQLGTPSDKFIYVHGNATAISLRITKNIIS
jgi:hypothetical protein